MKYTMRKVIAFLMVLTMVFQMAPVSVLADSGTYEGGQSLGSATPPKNVSEGNNVVVTVDASGVDLSKDGSRYYIVVGSNDEIAPYQYIELEPGNPAGDYGFTVDRLSEVDTMFVLLKRYEPGETPTPETLDHQVVFNMGTTNTLDIDEDTFHFTWSDDGDYHYTIGITQETQSSGGDEPSGDGHTVIVKLGKGVNIGTAYAVFSITKDADIWGSGTPTPQTFYAYVPLEGATSGQTVTVSSGTVFKFPQQEVTANYEEGDTVTVRLLVNASGPIKDYHLDNNCAQLPNIGTVINCADPNPTYNGQNVSVSTNAAGTVTTIQIGDMPAYDAEITFTEGGTTVTPTLTEKYYILAGVDENSFDFFAPVSSDGSVGAFTGNGVLDGGKLPAIQSLQIIKYTGSNSNPTLSDLISADSEWIDDGGDLDGFTVSYPATLEPDNDTLSFTAVSPQRYDSSIKYYEANGTPWPYSAGLNGNYFIVALDNGEPVYYAEVPENSTDLVFRDSNGNERKITGDLTFEIRKTSNGGNVPFSEVVASDTPSTLGEYILTSAYDEENKTCVFTAKKNDKKAVNVVYYKNDGEQQDPDPEVTGNFYLVVSVDDEPLYYGKILTDGSNMPFSNGVDTFTGVPSGDNVTFKLVEYAGTSSDPTLEELKDLPEANKLSKYEWSRDESVTYAYVFKAVASNDLYVRVSTYEADDETPLVPEDPITGQYYVRVELREAPVTAENKDNPPQAIGYCLAPFTFDNDATYTDIKLTKFVALDKSAFDDDTNAPPLAISSYYPDYENVRVLKLKNDGNKPSTYEQACDKTNYVDDSAPEGWAYTGKDTTGDGCNVHLKRAEKTPRYHVRLKFDTTDPSEISLDGGAWLKVTVDHESGPDTYGFIKLSNAEHKKSQYMTVDQDNGCIYIDIPVTEWKDSQGNVLEHEHFTGNEQGITVSLSYCPVNTTPAASSDIPEHDYINSSEIAAYPTGTNDVDHLVEESDNYIDVYDVITLHQNDDKFTGYTLEEILNGYNIVALCPNKVASPSDSGASAFGDGDFLMEKHQMGGVLIRGDIIRVAGTGVADSADIRKPSVVGGYVPVSTDPFFNNRENNNNGWNAYIGSVNTVAGDHYVNGHYTQGRGYTGTNTGVTVVDDNYVDWDRLQNMVVNTSNSLGNSAVSSVVSYDSNNNVYTVPAGSNALINYPEKTIVTINIEVRDEQGNLVDFSNATGYDANGNLITYKDYSGIAGTVVSNLGTGTYYPPKVQINGVPLTETVEDGRGMSLLWNFPNAKEVYIPGDVTPQFGHVVAPKAFINAPEEGNNSGCLVGNKVRSKLEGHLYPYKGSTLIGFYGNLGFEKQVNDGKPTERQKYDFTLEKLTPSLTNSEYTERMSKLTGNDKEQRVFWERLQTVQNEADAEHENSDIISFEDISFDTAGTYYFRVYENPATITNTTLDARQYLIECKVGSYTTNNGAKTELRMSSVKYYEIDTSKQLLNITSSGSGKNASLNMAAIGAAHTLEYDTDKQECDTGITFKNSVTKADYFVTLEGTKHLDGRKLRDKEFNFVVTDVTDSENKKIVATGTNKADGSFDNEIHFTQIPYEADDFVVNPDDPTAPVVRTFIYEITEVRPDEATEENDYTWENITYDPSVITATVVVTYNPEADVNCGENPFSHETTYNPANDTFSNTYTATIETDLKAKKSISGKRNEFQDGDTWTFTVEAADKADSTNKNIPLPVKDGVQCIEEVIHPAEGDVTAEVDFGTITFTSADAGKTYVYTIHEEGEVDGVKNDSDKTVEITIIENDDGTLSITRTPSTQVVSFTNFAEGETQIKVNKIWKNSKGETIERTSGSATVQLIAVRTEVGQQSHEEIEADLDVNIAWANDIIPNDAVIEVTTDGKTIILNSGNNYRGTFEDLTIGETYTLTATVVAGDGTVLTTETVTAGPIIDGQNTATFNAAYIEPVNTKDLTVSISWAEDNEPENDINITATLDDGSTVTLNSGNNWTADFTDLPVGRNCRVQLTVPEGNNITIAVNPQNKQIEDSDNNNTLVFAATYTSDQPATQDLNITINWNNIPSDLSTTVYAVNNADENDIHTLPLSSNGTNTWSGTIQGLTVGNNYRVYCGTFEGSNANNADVTNDPQNIDLSESNHTVVFSGTYTQQQQQTADLNVSIDWGENTPNDLYVQVSAGDNLNLQLDRNNNWSGTISNLTVGQTYIVSVGNKWGNDANNSNITNSPQSIQIAAGTNNVTFTGQYTGGQSGGSGSIPVTINWNNAPNDVTITVTATRNGQSQSINISSGSGNTWTGVFTGLEENQNYVITYSISGTEANEVTLDPPPNQPQYINSGSPANYNGTYNPVQEGKCRVIVYNHGNIIKQEDLDQNSTYTINVNKNDPNAPVSFTSDDVSVDGTTLTIGTERSAVLTCNDPNWTVQSISFIKNGNGTGHNGSVIRASLNGIESRYNAYKHIANSSQSDVSLRSGSNRIKTLADIIGDINEADYEYIGEPITLSPSNNWEYLWQNLPEYCKDEETGKEYTLKYYVYETSTDPSNIVENAYTWNANETEVTVTNTEDSRSVTVQKKWLDTEGNELPWPEGASAAVQLMADDVAVDGKTATLTAANPSATFNNLPITNTLGNTIVYTFSETNVTNGYHFVDVTGSIESSLIVTNSQDETSIEVDKAWLNAGGSTTWPSGVTVGIQLTADGSPVSGKTATLSEDNPSYKFTELPKYQANGTTEIAYSVEEVEVPGYESEVGDLTSGKITVTNKQKETSLEVEKTWVNADGSDTWPEGVTVTIQLTQQIGDTDATDVSGKTLTLSENKTSDKFEHLPKCYVENGKETEIKYGVKELDVAGYTSSVDALAVGKITVTNTRDKGCLEIKKTVTVNGAATTTTLMDGTYEFTVQSAEGVTPKTTKVVKITFKNGKISAATIDGENATVESDGTVKIMDLPTGDYTVTETEDGLAGKGIKLTQEPDDKITVKKDGTGSIQTAEFINNMEVVSASVQKIWKDENNADGIRPLKLIVHLKARGKIIETVELTAANAWIKTIQNLPKCDDQGDIEYTWEEETPSGYTLESTKIVGTLTTLTNVYTPEKTSISVHKVWDDQDNAGGTRPNEIKVQLFADGKAKDDPVTLNAGNGWSYTWKGLKKNCNLSGNVGGSRAVVYTVEEVGVPSGYQVSVSGDAKNSFEITNSIDLCELEIRKRFKYEPAEEEPDDLDALVSIPVLKVWDDNENKDQNRPESITVRLYEGGKEIDRVTLNAGNGWAHTFKDLPKYKDNKTIRYSVSEDPVDMYTTQISGSAESGYTIVNQYTAKVTSVMVRKVWDDNDNELKIRPTSIRMTLSNGMSVILNEANGWTAVIDNLPAIVDGKPAVYTWTEQEVPGYKPEGKVTNGSLTTFTNRVVKLVKIPPDQPQPRIPGDGWVIFEEYDTALGGELLINHVGDCFD